MSIGGETCRDHAGRRDERKSFLAHERPDVGRGDLVATNDGVCARAEN